MLSTAHQPMADLNRALACESDADAFSHLLRAAEAGCLRAQSLVGLAYHTGRGVAVDFGRAADWYGKAAGGADSFAIANLGVMNLLGQGAADEIDAYTWLRSAVGLGRGELRPALEELERRITGNADSGADALSVSPQTPLIRPCTKAACDPSRCDSA